MKKILVSMICLGAAWATGAQNLNPLLVTRTVTYAPAPNGIINFWQYTPPNFNSTDLFPLIISVHGIGQAGESIAEINNVLIDGLPALISTGKNLLFTWQGKTEGFVMLAPQANRAEANASWPNTFYIDQMINYALNPANNLHVDPARIFLVGFSAGGGGVWRYASSSVAAASRLAGIAPGSSSDVGTDYCNIASSQVAVWAFHGGDDGLIPAQTDHAKAVAINSCSPRVPAVDTIVANESHNIYNSVIYDLTNDHHYPNVFQWMLKVNRNLNPVTNLPPVPVIAGGTSLDLTTPVKVKDFPVLDATGSTDADDIIMDYLWKNTQSPPGSNISLSRDIWPVATVSAGAAVLGMPIGNYNFRLRVRDYLTTAVYGSNNHTQFANLAVTIHYPASGFSAPATDAGGSVTISSTETQVLQRIGQAERYPCTDCDVVGYNWVQLSGPSATLSNFHNAGLPYPGGDNAISFTGLNSPGVYTFQFSATTRHGDVGSDIFTITKLAALPVTYSYFSGVNAGNKNVLSWATTAEVNSERFDIQRSTDGIAFSVIGSVSSRGGAVLTSYTFDDTNAPGGLAYYRLSQVDKDGRTALSPTVSVNNRKAGLYVEKYPNPVHDNLMITVQGNMSGTLQVLILDMQGKTLWQQQWQKNLPQLKKIIHVEGLQNGLYQLIITGGQEKQVSSFVKY
ncbi:MAG: T9SS type A sorting domain-containing protein [Bacteroidota bacterium]